MFNGIDLSSDTATKPSMAMRKFMLEAVVGDEQKHEDPTTLQLEQMVAELLRFETAVFLSSATMANEIAICALSNPGDILLAAENSHILLAECGGPAIHAKVLCRPILTSSGIFTPQDIKHHHYWKARIYHPSISVLSVENTTNFGGGYAWSKDELTAIIECAKELHINTHLDGSRIFNASIKANLSVYEITKGFDMVTICLSKGLGCPVGALLVYNKHHDEKVQLLKQLMGGGMRQTGILAAAGIYALEHNINKLAADHEHASFFAKEISQFNDKIKIVNNPPATNMVFFEWEDKNISLSEFLNKCLEKGVRFSQIGKKTLRAVMHLDITSHDVAHAVEIVKTICI